MWIGFLLHTLSKDPKRKELIYKKKNILNEPKENQTKVIESVLYNDGKGVTSGISYPAKIILNKNLTITKTYYLFATESNASNANVTSVKTSQNVINATAVNSTNKTELTFQVNAPEDYNKTKLLVVVEFDANKTSEIGTCNVSFLPKISVNLSSSKLYKKAKDSFDLPISINYCGKPSTNYTLKYVKMKTEPANASGYTSLLNSSVSGSQTKYNITLPDSINSSNPYPFYIALIKENDIISKVTVPNIIYCAIPKVDNLTDAINTTGYKYTAEQPIKLSFNAVAAVNATEASPKYKLGNSEPVNATLTQKEGNLYEFTITAPSDISEDSKVNITVSITDPAGQTANSSELQISLGKSPYLSAPTVVAENHTEPFKAGEYIPVKVTFQHFEAKTGSFQYRFYTDQEWINLTDDNVTEVETPSAIKKLHAEEGKTYLLNIPAPKYEDIKEDGKVKLQIRLARSNDQAQSNIIETEVSLQKQQYVAPTPENSGLTGGQKAGIVIGVLLAVIIIILIIYFVFRRKPSKVKSSSDIQDDSGSGVNV